MIQPSASRPLEHIRVLDLTRVLAGPWATQNLADLGADVIKVERPAGGDETRGWGPPWLEGPNGESTGESAYFLSVNRGKRSITVDLSRPAGQRLIRELAAKCDVLVENFKVGDLARHGLAYEDIRQIAPNIIYCSITGFGPTGPYAQRPGYDFLFQAMGGLMSITGEADDRPGGGPQKVGIAITDVLSGMYASLAITAAIAHRDRTGVGQHIDLALFEVSTAFMANQALNYWCSGVVPTRHGNAHANIVPYQVFSAADADVVLAVGNDGQFASFCAAARRAELANDPRFVTNADRVRNRSVLVPMIADIMKSRSSREWIAALTEAGVPCGPINDLAAVFEDPQIRHRGMRVDLPHASGAMSPTVASPMRFSETPVVIDRAPPTLGQHTREVLTELLGLSPAELDELSAQGAF